jgi:hypothetical protein
MMLLAGFDKRRPCITMGFPQVGPVFERALADQKP